MWVKYLKIWSKAEGEKKSQYFGNNYTYFADYNELGNTNS